VDSHTAAAMYLESVYNIPPLGFEVDDQTPKSLPSSLTKIVLDAPPRPREPAAVYDSTMTELERLAAHIAHVVLLSVRDGKEIYAYS
jgi:hypothetical protein